MLIYVTVEVDSLVKNTQPNKVFKLMDQLSLRFIQK